MFLVTILAIWLTVDLICGRLLARAHKAKLKNQRQYYEKVIEDMCKREKDVKNRKITAEIARLSQLLLRP